VKLLVTGAGGFVGQYLLRELLGTAAAVVGTTVDGAPPAAGVLEPAERERVRWVALDVTDATQVAAVVAGVRPDGVFHLAAQSSVGASFADALATWEVNATGTLRLLLALGEHRPGARFLLVSSAEVYGAVPEAEQPIAEDRRLAPTNPYGASKAAAEIAALQAAAAGGVEVVVARSFNHTGPAQDSRFALPSWAAQLAEIRRGRREPVLRVGNLEARRDLLDVRDVVRAYRLLLERGERGMVYNVCSGVAVRLRDVVAELVELSGTGAEVVVDPGRLRPVDVPLLQGDPRRLRQLGWQPRIPLRQTLIDMLAAAETNA
jgi:GDP-4-dehydro-6-deoxy-D-mannose reductase